jgi:AraC family transcriptional regulator
VGVPWLHDARSRAYGVDTSKRVLSDGDLQRVIEHLNDKLDGPITLASMAAVLGLSPFHFARLFKATVGYAPIQYLIELRLRRAAELLSSTAMPLLDIALDLGFSDGSHMCRLFRRRYGVTPSSMRHSRRCDSEAITRVGSTFRR